MIPVALSTARCTLAPVPSVGRDWGLRFVGLNRFGVKGSGFRMGLGLSRKWADSGSHARFGFRVYGGQVAGGPGGARSQREAAVCLVWWPDHLTGGPGFQPMLLISPTRIKRQS